MTDYLHQGKASRQARFGGRGGKGRAGLASLDGAALRDSRTMHLHMVQDPTLEKRVLKSGEHNGKIGKYVRKGRLKGFPIFTLTLEERATCPKTCLFWRSCYGNGMSMAPRWKHGLSLEWCLDAELRDLAEEHPGGFLVRLHVLGDFYSHEYVQRWQHWLRNIPQLHVFGFTARNDLHDPMAQLLLEMVSEFGFRFAMRFSNGSAPTWSTETIEIPEHRSEVAFICPQQLGIVATCGDCGACWSTRKRIAFLRH